MSGRISDDLMYRLLVQGVRDYAIYMLDENGGVLNWNAGAERAKGYSPSEIIGRNYECFYSPDDRAAGVPQRNLSLALQHGRFATEGWRYRKDGTAFWASVVIEMIRDDEGKFVGFAKVTRDLTEKRDAELRAQHQARHDGLTGVLNRQGFSELLAQRLREAFESRHIAVFYVDLDHFKPVNDTFGHAAGDAVLREASRRLGAIAGEHGALGRIGGDEFALFVPDPTPASIATDAHRIVDDLSGPMPIGDQTFTIGACVGVAVSPNDGNDVSALLRSADLAMYQAKVEGRGRYRAYDSSLGQAALARSNLEFRLRRATAEQDFYLLYQPIVDGRSGRTLGYESLIRWTDEAGAAVSPAAFIPLAESIGLMPAIGEWTLRTACAAAAAWPDPLYVSVNLAATQFKHPPLAELVIRTLIETGLPARRLMLEITETSVLEDLPVAKRTLARLRGIGVGIALDDFGTGFSSLSLVKELPLTCIKIDPSFVCDQDADHTRAVVRSIVTLCDGYDLFAVAEGVETDHQRGLLLANGCTTMQGYFFGHPSRSPIEAEREAPRAKVGGKRVAS